MNPKHDLSAALSIAPGDIVSIVGAGVKTTTVYRLCRDLRARGLDVISTTTTAIQRPTPAQSPLLLLAEETPDLRAAVESALSVHGHVTVVSRARRADKYEGVDFPTVALLAGVVDVVVVEADGARHSAIKAPAEHEPPVPPGTTAFLSVAGLHALGRPLRDACHRPEIAARVAGQPEDSPVTADTLSRLLRSPHGGLKNRPERARAWALLTHLAPENEAEARAVATRLQGAGYTGAVTLSHDDLLALF